MLSKPVLLHFIKAQNTLWYCDICDLWHQERSHCWYCVQCQKSDKMILQTVTWLWFFGSRDRFMWFGRVRLEERRQTAFKACLNNMKQKHCLINILQIPACTKVTLERLPVVLKLAKASCQISILPITSYDGGGLWAAPHCLQSQHNTGPPAPNLAHWELWPCSTSDDLCTEPPQCLPSQWSPPRDPKNRK